MSPVATTIFPVPVSKYTLGVVQAGRFILPDCLNLNL